MSRIKPTVGDGLWLALAAFLCVEAVDMPARGQQAPLLLASHIQYPVVIQGAVDPVYAYVFNSAPFGSPAGSYRITAGYGTDYANSLGSFVGSMPANGGTLSSPPAIFNVNTARIAPGAVPVAVTLSNTVPRGNTVTQGGQFTVLAHARPSLSFGGAPVSLLSSGVIKFQTPVLPVFGEAAPAGTEAAGGAYSPQMLGDPPGVPTANLDLDSFSSYGSPNITSTLRPEDNLPSTDTVGTGEYFNILVQASGHGSYDTTFNTTFVVHYSDEQDLPGADAPGSQEAAFDVNVEIEGTVADWTITTGIAVPEPSTTAALLATACGCCWVVKRAYERKNASG